MTRLVRCTCAGHLIQFLGRAELVLDEIHDGCEWHGRGRG